MLKKFILVFGCCLLLYWPALKAEFVLDAYYVVVENPSIKQWGRLPEIWQTDFFDAHKGADAGHFQYYRPLVETSFMFDYHLWGLNPAGYRLVNIIFHSLNAVLVFFLVQIFSRDERLSLTAMLLFAILPVHEWVVNYVVGRGDLMYSFFSLLSLFFLVRFLHSSQRSLFLASLGSFTAALLCREIAVVQPLFAAFVVFAVTRDYQRAIKIGAVFGLIGFFYLLLRQLYFPILPLDMSGIGGTRMIFQWFYISMVYVFRYFLPWTALSAVPALANAYSVQVLACAALFLLLYLAARRDKKRKTIFLYGVFWLWASCLPFFLTQAMLNRLGPYLAEHFLYLGGLGFVLIFAQWLCSIPGKGLRQFVMLLICFYYAFLLVDSNRVWTTEKNLLSRVDAMDPYLDRAATRQLLMKYKNDKSSVQCIIDNETSRAKKSLWSKRMGFLYRQESNYEQAKKYLNDAVTLNPDNLEALNLLAVCALETGEREKGIQLLEQSLKKDFQYWDTHRLLGIVAFDAHRLDKARYHFHEAAKLQPENTEVQDYLKRLQF